MLVNSQDELVDNILSSVSDLLRSVETNVSQKDMVRIWKILGILSAIQNDRFDAKYANTFENIDYLVDNYLSKQLRQTLYKVTCEGYSVTKLVTRQIPQGVLNEELV